LKTPETAIIDRYFRDLGAVRADVRLGIGDDAALVEVPADQQLVLTTDSLVAGVHFLPQAAAQLLGGRALAVNLSDIAAMGARPAWALLSLTLPAVDDEWLAAFASGFGALARAHDVALIGGNLSRGPLNINVQLAGLVPRGRALTRAGARPGDVLCVSGTPGDAALGLALLQGRLRAPEPQAAYLRARFESPTPRLALGERLREVASACIDVSDGLYVDAARLAAASSCGLVVDVDALPRSAPLTAVLGDADWRGVLAGGDDYELCFAVPRERLALLPDPASAGVAWTRIGELRAGGGVELRRGGAVTQFSAAAFDHFGI
jgi:thiamine-monophosphate kinase